MALIDKLSAIGDAIREKTGKEDLLTLDQMPIEIQAIETGGGGGDLPEEAFNITGSCAYRFANNGWNWFIEKYGNRIITKDITNMNSMFLGSSQLKRIPFKLNFTPQSVSGKNITSLFFNCRQLEQIDYDIDIGSLNTHIDCRGLFQSCESLKSVPYIYNLYIGDLSNLFQGCSSLRYIPDDYIDTWNLSRLFTYKYSSIPYMFSYCNSLRKVPEWLVKFQPMLTSSSYSILYYYLFADNFSLDEVINFPVLQATLTGNTFISTFRQCHRLKNMIFKLNDDNTPQVAQWKNQTIDLTNVGTAILLNITSFNSGITKDKQVYDDTTYQALKNDPDWFTTDSAYSRFNHDSAVNTINSLPDTSAYGTNIIKFTGASGSATDGGAINTLTEEEIAVATAKGWTVTLV